MQNQEILTGLTYYKYHFMGGMAFLGFAFYQYFFGNIYVAISDGAAALSVFCLIFSRLFINESAIIKEAILVTIILAICSACYFLGWMGVIWLFPLVMAVFFNHTHLCALIVSLASAIVGLILAANVVAITFLFQTFLALLMCISFAYLYRVTIEKERQALLKEANVDYLTGISNRRSFNNWLQRILAQHVNNNRFLAVFYLDIDNFKHMNDTYGHEFGDKVLQKISKRLVDSVRQVDIVGRGSEHFARLAGDEFVIAAANMTHEHHADLIAKRLLKSVNAELSIDGIETRLSTSIGVALCNNRNISAEELLSEADAAMYRSKESGKNRVTFFNDEIATKISEKQNIARGIEKALQNNDFFLHFMPIFKLDAKQQKSIAGVEALLRCCSESLAGLGPDKFIPVAEEFGSIKQIDLFVIDKAFETIKQCQQALPKDFVLAINISAAELLNPDFPEELEQLANKHKINRSMVELEITETSLVSHDDSSIAMLCEIKALGFKLSLDDFGTGYTAFSQLHHYPVDTLKIDRGFVWNITDENQDKEKMIDVILSLAKLYGVKIIAEGVENQVQLDYLVNANCDFFQGFYLSKPLAWQLFEQQYLKKNTIQAELNLKELKLG